MSELVFEVDLDETSVVVVPQSETTITVGEAVGTGTGGGGATTIAGITGLQTALNAKEATVNKGAVNGYAPLDSSALVPSINLPSYVDDVLEYANLAAFPATGVAGKIYVALDSNKTYRWSGSAYVEVSPGPGSTDSVVEGSSNLYYTNARADARITAATGVTVQPYDADLTAFAAKTAPTGAVVGTTDTQTLSGKTISGASNTVNNLAVSALSATGTPSGTTYLRGDNTWSTPAGGGGDVTLTGAQTLTNKTIGDKLDITTVSQPATPSAGTARLYARIGVSGVESIAYLNTLGVPIVVGRDICFFAKNTSGVTITKGSVVCVNSASGSIPLVVKAQADSGMTKLPAAGVVVADIANNAVGLVMIIGTINSVNTSGVGAGNTLYVSPTTAGLFTDTRPSHPNIIQPIGECLNSNATTGAILVNVNEINAGIYDGTNQASWSVGDGTGAGAKSLLFKNSNTGTLTWTPTTTRTITLPDATGTVYISGGTDVPITDGGTGVSTLPTGLLKGAGTGAITAATAGTDYVAPGGALGTPSSGTLTNCTFPTLNQNTTGSAATLTTARTINGVSFNGSANIVVVPRIGTTTSSATPSIDCGIYDQYNITALAANITSVTITGTPTDGQKLLVRITGTATRTIAWGSSFQSSGVATLLATTSGTNTHLVGFIYDGVKTKFVCVAVDATGY